MTLRWVPGWNGLTEPEAVSYVAAVEAADGEPLEFGVARAINDFVVSCKNDGIWDAIKASCILAGARTLSGALVPLKGTAPTNNNFVSGDYNRETGLVGDGSTKYLDSNRNNNADPQNNQHLACYASTVGSNNTGFIGSGAASSVGVSQIFVSAGGDILTRSQSSNSSTVFSNEVGLLGISRSSSSSYTARTNESSNTVNVNSQSPNNANLAIFNIPTLNFFSNARLSFYSIGESLDLAKLDTRVSALITAIGAAIP